MIFCVSNIVSLQTDILFGEGQSSDSVPISGTLINFVHFWHEQHFRGAAGVIEKFSLYTERIVAKFSKSQYSIRDSDITLVKVDFYIIDNYLWGTYNHFLRKPHDQARAYNLTTKASVILFSTWFNLKGDATSSFLKIW